MDAISNITLDDSTENVAVSYVKAVAIERFVQE